MKKLEENIEAERAAHLESKFNSEIIQVRHMNMYFWYEFLKVVLQQLTKTTIYSENEDMQEYVVVLLITELRSGYS